LANFDDHGSKPALGDLSPLGASDSSWNRLQPLIGPRELIRRHLMGIPLISGMRGIDGKAQRFDDPEYLKDMILEAVSLVETEVGIEIFPTQIVDKLAFDQAEFRQLGFFKLRHRPVASIESLTVTPSNGVDIYNVPLDWVEVSNLAVGQVNIIPLNISTVGGGFVPAAASQTGGAAFFLSVLSQRPWIPAFWKFTYTTGFPEGKLPTEVNQLVGVTAAMEVLSMLAATYTKSTGHSVSIDGLGQSLSLNPQLFKIRMDDLAAKRMFLVGKVKARYMLKLFSNNL
jgi:hypothetical protein